MKVIDEKPVTFADAKEILEGKEKNENFGYEQKITLEYLRKFANVDKKLIDGARGEIEALNILKEHQVIMVLNLLPKNEEEMKVLFMKERVIMEKEQMNKILVILDKIRPKSEKK